MIPNRNKLVEWKIQMHGCNKHISLVQFPQNLLSVHALVVFTPEKVSIADAQKELKFSKRHIRMHCMQ